MMSLNSAAVPITPYLEGAVFQPETIKNMGVAFDHVCKELRLRDNDDTLNRIIARAVIEKAHNGINDPGDLIRAVLNEFRPARPSN